MPIYEYHCPANGQTVEVLHGMNDRMNTWGKVCALAGIDVGDTAPDEPVERLLFPVGLSTPASDSKLKEMGFTKLVRRDSGVYENVTASENESRYVQAGDPSTMPNFKKKIKD